MKFDLPPYPYDRLLPLRKSADSFPEGAVDLSTGTPFEAPPSAVLDALITSDSEWGYPPSIGSLAFREAAAGWLERRFGIKIEPTANLAACIGTKEFVVSTPRYLALRSPQRDTVLYPEVSYPSYAMGAALAGCRAVAVPLDTDWRLDLDSIDPDDVDRALCLWVNSPGNPAGALEDLGNVATWGRYHHVPVFSDECYIEFTWEGQGRSILEHGTSGVVAVHSLSKRSNMAGIRTGFYAGDPELVQWLSEIRKHAGNMVPGPAQAAAVVAFSDDQHVDQQRDLYFRRIEKMAQILIDFGYRVDLPRGGFYLWVEVTEGDSWRGAELLAKHGGLIASPGEIYGSAGSRYLRLAMVQPEERLDLVAQRLGVG